MFIGIQRRSGGSSCQLWRPRPTPKACLVRLRASIFERLPSKMKEHFSNWWAVEFISLIIPAYIYLPFPAGCHWTQPCNQTQHRHVLVVGLLPAFVPLGKLELRECRDPWLPLLWWKFTHWITTNCTVCPFWRFLPNCLVYTDLADPWSRRDPSGRCSSTWHRWGLHSSCSLMEPFTKWLGHASTRCCARRLLI